jgi:hypothetical protein
MAEIDRIDPSDDGAAISIVVPDQREYVTVFLDHPQVAEAALELLRTLPEHLREAAVRQAWAAYRDHMSERAWAAVTAPSRQAAE